MTHKLDPPTDDDLAAIESRTHHDEGHDCADVVRILVAEIRRLRRMIAPAMSKAWDQVCQGCNVLNHVGTDAVLRPTMIAWDCRRCGFTNLAEPPKGR